MRMGFCLVVHCLISNKFSVKPGKSTLRVNNIIHVNIGFDTFVQQLLSLNFVFSFEVEIRRIFSQSLVELRQQSPCPKIAHVFLTLNLFV